MGVRRGAEIKVREQSDGIDWRKRAACIGVDPDIFFPNADKDIPRAKAVCQDCQVSQPCLEFALALGEGGVWGGTDEADRQKIRKRRRA